MQPLGPVTESVTVWGLAWLGRRRKTVHELGLRTRGKASEACSGEIQIQAHHFPWIVALTYHGFLTSTGKQGWELSEDGRRRLRVEGGAAA